MAWQDGLLPGSFRGIPFFIDTHEKTGGRNPISHEPPDRDSSFAEDIGKKSDGYRITAHVLGDSYFFIRDALIDAMEKKDTGILIHPYLGLIDVQPGQYRITEDTKEGRIARFDLNFIEAGDPNVVFAFIDSITGFITGTFALIAQVQNAVDLAASFSGLPAFAIDSAEDILSRFVVSVRESVDTISTNAEELSALNSRLEEFGVNINTLINSPKDLASDADTIISNLKTVPAETVENDTVDISSGKDDKEEVFNTLLEKIKAERTALATKRADLEAKALAENRSITATRAKEAKNNEAIVNMLIQTILARKSEVMVDKLYKSEAEAIDARESLNDDIDLQANEADIDDDLFQTLKDQKALITTMIPDPRQDLATEKTITLLTDLPSIVISYDLYESLDNETDLLDRNGIKDPSFISGDVEVISCG